MSIIYPCHMGPNTASLHMSTAHHAMCRLCAHTHCAGVAVKPELCQGAQAADTSWNVPDAATVNLQLPQAALVQGVCLSQRAHLAACTQRVQKQCTGCSRQC